MLIPCRYVKNRFDVYGRDSSIFSLSRRGPIVDRISAFYTILLVEERFESKRVSTYTTRDTASPTLAVRHGSLRNLEDSG